MRWGLFDNDRDMDVEGWLINVLFEPELSSSGFGAASSKWLAILPVCTASNGSNTKLVDKILDILGRYV